MHNEFLLSEMVNRINELFIGFFHGFESLLEVISQASLCMIPKSCILTRFVKCEDLLQCEDGV